MEKCYTAKNKIKIYSYKNPALHGFFISLFLRSGSMYESDSECGITHFLEHILVRNVNKIYQMGLYSMLDRYGLEFNASTYAEMVQFYLSGASPSFSPIVLSRDEVDAERRRIKAEIRENDDKNSMSSFAMSEVYPDTSLKNSITGTNKSVDRISVTRLEEYRRRVFTRDNLFFYVTGNYDDSDLRSFAQMVGEVDIAEPSGEPRDNIAPIPQNFGKRGGRVAVKNSDYTMVRFNFDLDMTRLSSPIIDLVYDNLFAGYNSPFFIKMSEEQGLFYDISGSTERYRNIGTLYFSFEVKEKDVYDAVSSAVDILNSFKKNGVSESECMKAGYTENAPLLYDDAREMNFTLAYDSHIMKLAYKDIEERRRAYEAVTHEQIRLGAREIFTPENLVLTVKGNKKKIDQERLGDICRMLSES